MKLCMFHPLDRPMERGWVGRIDGDRVVHLAAQTLQSFFTGGGSAREHDVYALADVRLLAPVLHPASIRVFDDQDSFAFANPAAILGPGGVVVGPTRNLVVLPRLAAVIGAGGAIGGFTGFAEWRAAGLTPPKDRDFGLGLGPLLVTHDEVAGNRFPDFDWSKAMELAAAGTRLVPGDVVAGPARESLKVVAGHRLELEIEGIGVLEQAVETA